MPHLATRVSQLAAGMPERGAATVRLRLDPPSLGEIRVQIASSSRGIEVRIVAQSHEACSVLADGQPRLQQELARHGLALHSFAASLGSEGRGDSPASDPDRRASRSAARASAAAPKVSSAAPAVSPTHHPMAARGLDRRV